MRMASRQWPNRLFSVCLSVCLSDEAIRDAQPESPSSVLCSPDCAGSMDYPSLEMSEKKRVLGKVKFCKREAFGATVFVAQS